MKHVVLDASVVSKWFIQEEESGKALEIRDLYVQGEITLSSPLLVLYEVGNVFFKHPSLTTQDCERALEALQGLQMNLESLAQEALLKDCMHTCKRFSITFYDASYVSLAQHHNAELITADKQLYKKIKEEVRAHLLPKLGVQELIQGRK